LPRGAQLLARLLLRQLRTPSMNGLRPTFAVLILCFLAASAALTGTSLAVSVKDSPGYHSLVDPESMSVVIRRRTNGPAVHQPFRGGAKSLDELGQAVVWTLHHTSTDSLLRLCVSAEEFKDILWREFPQSRPATGLQWDDAWKILYARQHAGCMHAMREFGGHPYQFLRFETDSIGVYRNFKLYSHLVLVTKDDTGAIQEWRWLRAVAERKGRFKIYSTED